jgi:hypothetical protein
MLIGRQPKGTLGALAAAVAIALLVSGSGTALAGTGQLRAFQRPARAGDAVPRALLPSFVRSFGPVAASRRVATATGFRGRAALYLVRTKRNRTCVLQTIRGGGGAGGGCEISREFLSAQRPVSLGEGGRFLNGVVANNIARVSFLDRHGRLHPVLLTRDGGFLYACRHHNGCAGLVSAVSGYDRQGRRVFHESLGQRPLP